MTLPSLVAKWGPVLALGAAIGGGLAAGAVWVYRVDSHIAWGEKRSAVLEQVDARSAKTEAIGWALLHWAREVSKREGWPEPPTIEGLAKPAAVRIPPPQPYRPGMYAAEIQPPKEAP